MSASFSASYGGNSLEQLMESPVNSGYGFEDSDERENMCYPFVWADGGQEYEVLWSHHVHSIISEWFEEDKSVEGRTFKNEMVHDGTAGDIFDQLKGKTAPNLHVVSFSEHNQVPEIEIYVEHSENSGYKVRKHDKHFTVEKGNFRAIGILGAQMHAWLDKERTARKDVIGVGMEPEYEPDVDSPQELYEAAARNSEIVMPTHMNMMTDLAPSSLGMKSMTNSDAREVKETAEESGTDFAVGLPSMYPSPLNRIARFRTKHFPGPLSYSLKGESFVNELDLHSLDELQGEAGTNRVYDTDLFEDLWEGSENYGDLLETVQPSGIPVNFDAKKMKAQIWNQRVKPALMGWKPE